MPIFFQYLLKLSFSLGIMYLFYQFVLRRLTFYNHNRWYLGGYALLCFFISVINISPILEKNEVASHEMVKFIPTVEALTTKVSAGPAIAATLGTWTIWSWVFVFLITGIGILLFRLILQLVSFKRLAAKARLVTDDEIKFYQVDKNIIPFSFGNSIFINQHLHFEAELKEIIRHEFVHVKQRHTINIVWGEILCILNWYNPFAWLIRKAIRQNLEFIADNKVLENGMDKKQYQFLLLKVIGNNHFSVGSNFNFSSLKKRIAMMNKIKSAKLHLIKFLFVLPLGAVLLLSFREVISSDNKKMTVRFNGIDTIPSEGKPEIFEVRTSHSLHRNDKMSQKHKNFFTKNPEINLLHWKENGSVEVYFKDGEMRSYGTKDELKSFENKYGKLPPPSWSFTKENDKLIDASLNGPSNPKTKITDKEQPLFIVNGSQWPEGLGVDILEANKIESIDIWKNEKAVTKYGEKGKNGAVIIITKKSVREDLQTNVLRIQGDAGIVYRVNGKEISKAIV
jgi:beta-lactamase regulating signal transducer with metallopeptidase domain